MPATSTRPSQAASPRLGFLSFPTEIRLQIYTHLIPAGSTVILPRRPHPHHSSLGASDSHGGPATSLCPRHPSPGGGMHNSAASNTSACRVVCRARMLTPDGIRPEAWEHVSECAYCVGKCHEWACLDEKRREGEVKALRAVLALLGTCRTVYWEVAEVFYDTVAVLVALGPGLHVSPAVFGLLKRVRRVRMVCDVRQRWERPPRREFVRSVEFCRARELVLEFPEEFTSQSLPLWCCLLGFWVFRGKLPELRAVRLVAAWTGGTWPRDSDSELHELRLWLEKTIVGCARSDVTVDVVAPRVASTSDSPFCFSRSCLVKGRRVGSRWVETWENWIDRFPNEPKTVVKAMRTKAIQWFREECEWVVRRQASQGTKSKKKKQRGVGECPVSDSWQQQLMGLRS